MTTMEDDLLSRHAVDENLSRLARERMKGRKLVGVGFDERSKSWYVVLKDGARALIRTCDARPRVSRHGKTRVERIPAHSNKK